MIGNHQNEEFKGTKRYASLNAHKCKVFFTANFEKYKDLSWSDDMWSFYFVILEFLNKSLPWNNLQNKKCEDEDISSIKAMCLANPEKYLWTNSHTKTNELMNIFYSIQRLRASDKPDYGYIHSQLLNLLVKEKSDEFNGFTYEVKLLKEPICFIDVFSTGDSILIDL